MHIVVTALGDVQLLPELVIMAVTSIPEYFGTLCNTKEHVSCDGVLSLLAEGC